MICINFIAHLQAQIDVVIPTANRDKEVLEAAIRYANKNVIDVGNVFVVSKERYTTEAEWVPESMFPFSFEDVGRELHMEGHEKVGWYYQQLLKFYAPFVIPNSSNDVLILDSDTMILKPMRMITEEGKIRFNMFRVRPIHATYKTHMQKVLPTLIPTKLKSSPVVHHMLFQKEKLEHLFTLVERLHKKPFWKVFLNEVDLPKNPFGKMAGEDAGKLAFGASEYTIYFHFVTIYYPNNYDIVHPRIFNDARTLQELEKIQTDGYDLASIHWWRRS